MNTEMKNHVIKLLDSYPERARKIALLRYELAHPAQITGDELIEAMNYARPEGQGHPSGHISNRTLYIALNYQERAERLNDETFGDISARLAEMEREQSRLEYYMSLLDRRQELVLRRTCFEKVPQEKVAKELEVSVRRIQDIKAQAIDALAEMYGFTAELR